MANAPDYWRPSASRDVLRLRAALLERARDFFAQRAVMEVETPILSHCTGTDPALASPRTQISGFSSAMYLQTSPEFHMKRLLAAGTGDIYQVGRVFRDGEIGVRHNPEFTMIEWYRCGMNYQALAGEACELVAALLGDQALREPERIAYWEAIELHAGLPADARDRDGLADALSRHGVDAPHGTDPAGLADLLFSVAVIPRLTRDRTTVIADFPLAQSALARACDDNPDLAQRFEIFVGPTELANGYQELGDGPELRCRLEREQAQRAAAGAASCEIDERLIAALEQGLPQCSGVALGFDRLVMLAAGVDDISSVMAFDIERA